MGFLEELGDAILSIGKPVTGFGLGFWILVGIGTAVLLCALFLFR